MAEMGEVICWIADGWQIAYSINRSSTSMRGEQEVGLPSYIYTSSNKPLIPVSRFVCIQRWDERSEKEPSKQACYFASLFRKEIFMFLWS